MTRSIVLSKILLSNVLRFNTSKICKMCTTTVSPEKMGTILTQNVKELAEMFKKRGYEFRVAGGAVRDLLMGRDFTDLDMATTATPTQMKDMFIEEEVRMINERGEKHGTITARYNEENYEFTTLKIDSKKDGSPGEIQFITDWPLDAERRDLTINSLFLDLDGNVYDYFNGLEHIKSRKIQFVVNPNDRIKEDYLRILRYFRFYGRIATMPDNHEIDNIVSIKENAAGLAQISSERIWTEVTKILTGNFALELMIKMLECGIGPYIGIPDNFDRLNFKLKYKELEEYNLLNDVHHITLLASGFQDLESSEKFIERVKCSNKEKDLLNFILKYRELVSDSDDFKTVQNLLVDTILIQRKSEAAVVFYVSELLKYTCKEELLDSFNKWEIPKFPIKGQILRSIAIKNKQIGDINRQLIVLWKESNFCLNEEELLNSLRDSPLCKTDALERALNSSCQRN